MTEEKVKKVARHFEKKFPLEGYENFKRRLGLVPDSYYDEIMAIPTKKSVVAILLAIFLGGIGLDRFYVGDKKMGIIKIVASVVVAICSIFITIPIVVTLLYFALAIFQIIDIFLSYKEGKRYNYDKVNERIHNIIAGERAKALAELNVSETVAETVSENVEVAPKATDVVDTAE